MGTEAGITPEITLEKQKRRDIRMHLIKCERGHIYDAEKFRACPHCYSTTMTIEDEEEILGVSQADKETQQSDAREKTQFYIMHRRRVYGMLVCVAGVMKGEAFLLKEGDNIIGRSANMDVALTMEETVSRQRHAVIDCDGNEGTLVLTYPEDREDVRVNNRRVKPGWQLKDRDVIRLGDCELVLVEAGDIWKN